MNIGIFQVSRHALRRMAQRNLTPAEVESVLELGRIAYRTGVQYFFLAAKDLSEHKLSDLRRRELERLVGATVITAHNKILTVYRRHDAISKIKRKPKFKRSRRRVA